MVRPRINRPALEWNLSRLIVEPVTEPIVRSATALAVPEPVTILASDPEDLAVLCDGHASMEI